MSKEELTPEQKHIIHQNTVFWKIQQNLPGDFGQFRYESLCEMIYDVDKGYTTSGLREDLVKAYKESPRAFMLNMLEEIKAKCDTSIHLLECKKCGIDLPLGEESV